MTYRTKTRWGILDECLDKRVFGERTKELAAALRMYAARLPEPAPDAPTPGDDLDHAIWELAEAQLTDAQMDAFIILYVGELKHGRIGTTALLESAELTMTYENATHYMRDAIKLLRALMRLQEHSAPIRESMHHAILRP